MSETSDADSELKRRARKILTQQNPDTRHLPGQNLDELNEELRIHQIELELQNAELQESQRALEDSRNKYLDLYDFAPVGYFTVDRNVQVIEANWMYFTLLGTDRTRLLGQSFARVVYPEDQDIIYLHYRHLFEWGEPRVDEVRLRRLDGSIFNVNLSTIAVRDDKNKVVAARSVMSDITERKRVEQELYQERLRRASAEQANVLKLQFLAMISHELRTPLASIKGFASTLLAEDTQFEPEQQREFLGIIDEESDRLLELIGQLLDVARVQAGTLRINRVSQTIYDAVHEGAMPRLETLTKNHPLVIDIPQDIPPILIDCDRIGQVIVNLVDNAAKYSPDGSRIILRAAVRAADVRVDVIDQGKGIPREEREHVFDIFRQLESVNQQGAGLGLAICKSLVEAHGGRIWIEDATGQGTILSFTLPLPSLPF